MAGRVVIAIGLSVTLTASPALALDPDRSITQLHHTAWTIEDGAPTQVTALAQTSDGYLWIGSSLGLFRFDGVAFERYVPPPGERLLSHNIYALVATDEGGLWVSFRPFGLALIKDGRLTVQSGPWEHPAAEIFVLEHDHDGRVWAGTSRGLAFHDASGWHEVGPEWNLPRERIWSLFTDRGGTLWVATETTIYSLARGEGSFLRVQSDLKSVASFSQSQDGRIWLTDDHEPDRLRVVGMGPKSHSFLPMNTRVFRVFIDRDDCMWVGANVDGDVLRVLDHSAAGRSGSRGRTVRVERFGLRNGLSGQTRVLFEDREGSIWVGTSGGIDRFRRNRLVPVALPPAHQLITLLPADSGVVWVGSSMDRPTVRIRGDAVTEHDMLQGVACVYRDSTGVAWWPGKSYIWRQDATGAVSSPLRRDLNRWIWAVFPGELPGSLWLSFDEIGLIAFENGALSNRAPPAGLTEVRGPSASFPAPDGRVWLGYNNRVYVLDRGRVTAFSQKDGIDVGRLRVIRGRGPHVWIGGELGLQLYHAGRFWTVTGEDGASFGTVSGIVEATGGDLWLNELRGIVRIPRAELAMLLNDPRHRVRYRRYDYLDGMPGGGQMNWTCSTAAEGTDGLLWFATDNGLVRIDPEELTIDSTPPAPAIRSIATATASYVPSSGLRLPKGTTSLSIQYGAMTLAEPERIRYRYRLEGLDREWREAGYARTAGYTRLKPGRYSFQVIAANTDGIWSSAAASLGFSIMPQFYQTTWFAVLLALAVAGVVGALFVMRMRQVTIRLQRLHDERIDERMRIAHELHDTLLQGFLSASMQLHVEANTAPPGSRTRSGLERILALMRSVTDEARDTLRGLRSSASEKVPDLEAAFTAAAQEFASASTAQFRLNVRGRPRPLQRVLRDEVYRVGRESLSNAFRHAQATLIEVDLSYQPDELVIVVRDDGRGIDPDILRDGREGHLGLSGMRQRAAEIGARLSLESPSKGGTEVVLKVPGRIAYAPVDSGGGLAAFARWLRSRIRPRGASDGGQ